MSATPAKKPRQPVLTAGARLRSRVLPRRMVVVVVAALIAPGCDGGTEPRVPTELVVAAGDGQSGPVATTLPTTISLRVEDQRGRPLPGVPVTWTTSGDGTVTPLAAETDGEGTAAATWTLGTAAGPQAATATAGGLAPVTFSATAAAGPPASVVVVGGGDQTGRVATKLPTPLVVRVSDAWSNPVPGSIVAWTVTAGGGSLGPAFAVSDVDGLASASWTLGAVAGANAANAAPSGLTGVGFTATGVPGDAAALLIAGGDAQVGKVGSVLPTPLVVRVQDAHGNAVSGIEVSWEEAGAGGSLTPVSAHSGADGRASAQWTLGDVPGTQTARAGAAGLPSVTFSATATVDAPDGLDLRLEGAYLVQSAQTLDGAVPLVANRDAYLRVFVTATQANELAPPVRVRLLHQGAEVRTYDLTAPGGSIPTTLDQGSLNASWNVLVPGSLIQPGLELSAQVDPGDDIPERDESNNVFPAAGAQPLDVRVVPPFRVRLVPVHQSANGTTGNVTAANHSSYTGFAGRLYPFHEIDADVRAPYTTSAPAVESDDGNHAWITILSELDALRVADGSGRYYYGVIPVSYSSGIAGYGYVGRATAVGWDRLPSGGEVAAHEWGHNFGRQHAPCGGAGNPDPSYPYAGGSIGVFGMDVGAAALKGPASHFDLMGYCAPDWISDYTYEAVMDFRGTAGGAAGVAAPRASLLVWGRIGPDGPVLEPAFELVTTPVLPAAPGPHRIEALDGTGRPLFALSFAATEVADAPGEARHFAFALPLEPGVRARLATLRLEVAGRLAERASVPGAAAPEVEVRRAGPRAVELSWDAARSPVILVRDAVSGEIVSFARGGSAMVASPARDLELILSDGVRSERRRVAPR